MPGQTEITLGYLRSIRRPERIETNSPVLPRKRFKHLRSIRRPERIETRSHCSARSPIHYLRSIRRPERIETSVCAGESISTWISGLFVGRSELKHLNAAMEWWSLDLRSIRRPERIETSRWSGLPHDEPISGLFVGRSELKHLDHEPIGQLYLSPVYS